MRGMKTPLIIREGLAEMMGTLVLCAVGVGSVAQFVLAKQAFGGYLSVNFVGDLALLLEFTGLVAYLAVTSTLLCPLHLPYADDSNYKLPVYVIAQMIGA